MIRFTVCIYAEEKYREWLTFTINQLQAQLNKANRQDVDVMYYVDKGEMDDQQKKRWLVDNSQGLYYTFITYNFYVDQQYLKKLLKFIDKPEVSANELSDAGIFQRILVPDFN